MPEDLGARVSSGLRTIPGAAIAALAVVLLISGVLLTSSRWQEMFLIAGAYLLIALIFRANDSVIPKPLRLLPWIILILSPLVVDFFNDVWLRMMFLVVLYVTLGLGLNVVVGLAGLLDLGYVAFFAMGAYVVAIFASPVSPAVDGTLNYWLLLPLAVIVGALFGVLLGLPVLPLRGDYLAIVTLGFGEIIRLFLLNKPDLTRGSSGLFELEKPALGSEVIDQVNEYYVMITIAAFLAWFVTSRLRDSRIGRAWEAIREDEDVAEAMGINTTRYKLMAFAIGAAIGALGGAIYAPFIDFVSPASFGLIVSINVLALVIIGGMGSTQGVIVGALLLIGGPELLQFTETRTLLEEFGWLRDPLNGIIDVVNAVPGVGVRKLPPTEDWGEKLAAYRFIIFGALLVLVMVLRPSGIFPSRRRQLEFEQPTEAEVAGEVGVT